MKKYLLLGLALATLVGALPAQDDKITATTNRVFLPKIGQFAHFVPINKIRPQRAGNVGDFKPDPAMKVTLPIDWSKNYSFPMDLNDRYGDCYYAAGCHYFDTLYQNNGLTVSFSLPAIQQRYFALSGGDNGLSDPDMQGEMKNRYVADQPEAKIVDFMYLDVTNPTAVQQAIFKYGVVMFTLAVPNNWINNASTGAVWDAGVANPNNGHAVIWNGVSADANQYTLQTWGTHVFITQRGVKSCDPGGWIAWSAKWFSTKTGYAPNGIHVSDSAMQWQKDGGAAIPDAIVKSFPPKTNGIAVAVADDTVQVGIPYTFKPIVTGGQAPYTFSWDYGDNWTGSTGIHTYAAAGMFTVTVTATDSAGTTGTGKATITATTAPPPSTYPQITVGSTINPGQYSLIPSVDAARIKADSDALSQIRAILEKKK